MALLQVKAKGEMRSKSMRNVNFAGHCKLQITLNNQRCYHCHVTLLASLPPTSTNAAAYYNSFQPIPRVLQIFQL